MNGQTPHHVKLILLDLGNVLYKIDFNRTIQALSSLPGYNGKDIMFGVDQQDDMFMQFDKGLTTPETFYNMLRTAYHLDASDQQIRNAWNAIMIEAFPFALHVPAQLRSVYQSAHSGHNLRIAVLSNISIPHLEKGKHDFPLLANPAQYGIDETYYSCAMGLRKPDPEIFIEVCKREQVVPQEAVLFDDSAQNVQAARQLGCRAVQVTPGDPDLAFRVPS